MYFNRKSLDYTKRFTRVNVFAEVEEMRIEIKISGDIDEKDKDEIEAGIDSIKKLLTNFHIDKMFKEFSGGK
jgi:hypothetical protein